MKLKLPWEQSAEDREKKQAETERATARVRAAMEDLRDKLDEADELALQIQKELNGAG